MIIGFNYKVVLLSDSEEMWSEYFDDKTNKFSHISHF